MTITDNDRETLDMFDCISERVTRKSALQAIAQAREEGRREEREACASECETVADNNPRGIGGNTLAPHPVALRCAVLIRARGNTTLPAADAASEV